MNTEAQPRTKLPAVLGWLSIGLGSYVAVLGWGCLIIDLLVLERFGNALFLVLASTMATGLVVIGVGQVDRRRWARRYAMGWAAVVLLLLAAMWWTTEIPEGRLSLSIHLAEVIAILAAYPILTLALMSTARAKAAMTR